jgi:hypothetical protein
MTEFIEEKEFRHFCRNPKCRSKLRAPVSNRREAFCARGCHTSFYLRRCLVCEGPLQRRNKTQRVCRKRRCRSAWRARASLGRYSPSIAVSSASETLDSIDSKRPLKPDRAWRQIAGPKLSASQLHCALVSAKEAIAEAHQKNRPYWRQLIAKALIQPHHPPVNILGGYKFPNAPDVKLREEEKAGFSLAALPNTTLADYHEW